MPIPPLVKKLVRRTGILFVIFLVAVILPAVVEFTGRYAPHITRALQYVAVLALFFQAVIWTDVAATYWTERYLQRNREDPSDTTTVKAVAILIKVAVWAILLLIALAQLGKNVTGIIAGLGIGGIAVAFALQNILSDLFAALSIVTDKPFAIGDAIQVDTFSGKVEYIGMKSTRVRSDGGEQIIFANSDLLRGRIRNFGRMTERTATIITRVAATTTPDQLARIPEMIEDIVKQRPATRFVRCTLTAVGDFTFDFTTVYVVTSPAYQLFTDSQQAVLLEITRQFRANDIALAAQLDASVKDRWARGGPTGL